MLKEDEEAPIAPPEPKVSFAEAAAKIDPSHVAASLAQTAETFPDDPIFRLEGLLDCFGSLFSRVSFQWDDIFKEPVWSKLFHDVIDLSHIPEPDYSVSVGWINQYLPKKNLHGFVLTMFSYIIKSMWKEYYVGQNVSEKSNVSILVALAVVLRSRPHVMSCCLRELRMLCNWHEAKGALCTPLSVWVIAQASQADLLVGLKSWAVILLPRFVRSNDQSKDLILEFVENISKKPDARTKLVNAYDLFPPPSFETLLRLTFFPASSAREEATTRRFAGIYPFLKDVALAGVPERPSANQAIFTFCLRLAKEVVAGNPDLSKEATEIDVWCLTKNVGLWELWKYLCKENLETSVVLLKRLVEKWEDHSLELSLLSSSDILVLTKQWLKRNKMKKLSFTQTGGPPTSDEEAIQEVKIQQEVEQKVKMAVEQHVKIQQVKLLTQKIFTFSLRLARHGNPVLAKEATEIAIWSLTKNVVWWKLWENLYMENLEASVAILKMLVEKLKDHSLELSSWSLNHTLARARDSKATKQVTQKILTQKIFTFSLRLAGRGNPDLAKEVTELAIWSLTENVDCWKYWDYLYKKNQEASVALLRNLVEKWKDRSLKLSSGSDTLGGAPEGVAMEQFTQKIYTFSLRLAAEGNPVLAKEATKIAIWSLAEKRNLHNKNLEAVVALLKKPVDKWMDLSIKLLSSPSDTLTLSRTMESLRLKNKKAITEGGANGSLFKEADKSCKVIWGRLSRRISSLKGAWIAGLVLVMAVAARTFYV